MTDEDPERNTTSAAANNSGRRKNQVNKENMYMMTALWMEQSPWNFKYPKNQTVTSDEKKLNVVGAVFVLPNDRVFSADCSRRNDSKAAKEAEGDDSIVHGAVQALIKYPDRVKNCKVYLSRKPCAHCVKMLVQAAVEKVFYLPLRPEKYDEEEDKSVDALFQVSTASRSFFVPDFTEKDIKELKEPEKPSPYDKHGLGGQENIYAKEWEDWEKANNESQVPWKNLEERDKKKTGIKRQLSWEEYDGEIEKQVDKDMKRMFEWFGMATFATGKNKDMVWIPLNDRMSKEQKFSQQVASHLSRLAQMLSNRTDDPNRGVGCVIAVDDEIVSVGWNGFPSKALYGNHPRGSRHDRGTKSKYPHVIHAEQNALMCRNRRDLSKNIAYVNKMPCDECMPMLYQLGVETVVIPKLDESPVIFDKSVDALFEVSTVSRSFFAPDFTEKDSEELKTSKKRYGEHETKEKSYAKEEWDKMKTGIKRQLSWEEYDGEIEKQVDEDMERMFEWFCRATFATGKKKDMVWKPLNDKKFKEQQFSLQVASHLSRLAQMLSNRTDDPNTGVGCVIAVDNEIVSVGWNGFPSKALYGNHPRGSTYDKGTKPKYPHVIYAEQNALMFRNRRDLSKSIAYVNNMPGDECMTMLYQLGVETVVLPNVEKLYFHKLLEAREINVYIQGNQNE